MHLYICVCVPLPRSALLRGFVFITTGDDYGAVVFHPTDTPYLVRPYFIFLNLVGVMLLVSLLVASFQSVYAEVCCWVCVLVVSVYVFAYLCCHVCVGYLYCCAFDSS